MEPVRGIEPPLSDYKTDVLTVNTTPAKFLWRPQKESNLRTEFRRLMFYAVELWGLKNGRKCQIRTASRGPKPRVLPLAPHFRNTW